MLKIIVRYRNGHDEVINWTLESSTRPFHPHAWKPSLGSVTVLATGPELGWIKQHFTGIPMVGAARQIRWTGEDAVFIVNNLPCASGAYGVDYDS